MKQPGTDPLAYFTVSRSTTVLNGYSADGAADDVQIQQAIDAAFALGGGTVYLGPGVYILAAPIALKNNVKVIGAGYGTQLKVGNNTNISAVDGNDAQFAELSYLRLEGNSANNATSGHGIEMTNNKFCRFYKVFVHDFRLDGVNCTPVGSNVFENNIFDGCEVWENVRHGFNITAKDCIIKASYIYNNTGNGINVNDGGIGGWQFFGNHIYGNSVGVRVTATTTAFENNIFVANYIEFNDLDGMHLSDEIKNNLITGNTFWNNGQTTADTYDGIKIDNPNSGWAANNVITGNKFWQRHRYSISIATDGSAPANVISGNDMEDNVSVRTGVDLLKGNTGQATNIFDTRTDFQEITVTPANPADGAQCRMYLKADKLVIQYNDAATIRYKYLDLTGTGVTWVHTTSAP